MGLFDSFFGGIGQDATNAPDYGWLSQLLQQQQKRPSQPVDARPDDIMNPTNGWGGVSAGHAPLSALLPQMLPPTSAAAQQSPWMPAAPLSSGAEPGAVWGGPAPANAPAPLPPPVNIGQQPPQQQAPIQPQAAPYLPPQVQPQQQPIAPQVQQPGIGDRLGASAQGFFNAGSPMQAIGNLLGGAITGNRMDLRPMKTGTDPNTGQETFGIYDPGSQAIKPVGGGTFGGQAGQNNGFLAPGVPYLNSSATGENYLKQWSPEVQATAKAYLAGHIIPTGNPRQNTLASKGKEVATKYAADMGIPFSDERYSEAKKFRTELGSTQPNTAGGQAKAFNQGIEHMSKLAPTLERLDNSNGMGIPWIADVINTGRQMTSTEQAAISDKAKALGQTLSGEVGKLFSGSAGGGVEERRMTRDRFDTVKSPKQLAGALEATLETMRGGLTALEQRRDQALMGNGADVRFVEPESEKKIADIEKLIERLKGNQPALSTKPGVTSSGVKWSVQ